MQFWSFQGNSPRVFQEDGTIELLNQSAWGENIYFYIFRLLLPAVTSPQVTDQAQYSFWVTSENASDSHRDVGAKTGKVTYESLNKRCKGHTSFISFD